jgi:hypothetical protein
VDSYGTVGLLLLFGAFLLLGYILLKARRPKSILHDEEIRRFAKIIQFRNAAAILSLCAYSAFFLLLSSIPKVTVGSPEYVIRNNLSDVALTVGLAMLITTAVLGFLGRSKKFSLKLQVRRDAIRARIRAKRRPRTRVRRSTRI